MSVMDKPVYHCRRHLLVSEYAAPFGELKVRSEDKAAALIRIGYHLEQELRTFTVNRNISPFIKDKEIECFNVDFLIINSRPFRGGGR